MTTTRARRWLAAGLAMPLLMLAPAQHQAPARKFICYEKPISLVMTRSMGPHGMRDFDATGTWRSSCDPARTIGLTGTIWLQHRQGLTGKWALAAKPIIWTQAPPAGTRTITIKGICYLHAYERLKVHVSGYFLNFPPHSTRTYFWPFFGRGMRTVNCDRRYPGD